MIYMDTIVSYNVFISKLLDLNCFPFISAVLMVDDDMLISAQDLVFAFSVWQVILLYSL